MSSSGSRLLQSFELTKADMREIGVGKLHAFSVGVRWPHRAEDWAMLIETGHGVAAIDEIGRVVGTAMWFPYSPGFATIGMVITSPRLQMLGTGRWLMEHVMADAQGHAFGLNATRAAYRLYIALGFTPERTLFQHNGEARVPPEVPLPEGAELRDAAQADLDALTALDAAAFGVPRPALLARLLAESKGVILLREGRIAAFALCRRFGRGHVMGPVVARTDAEAIAVIRPHVAALAGRFLRLDTRRREGAFSDFLVRSGLPVYDTVTTMSLGRPWLTMPDAATLKQPQTYGVASQALG